MKTLRYMFPILLLLAALLVSCVAEPVSFSNRENEQEVRITINTGTRAEEGPGTPAGDLADRYINSLRILGYRISDGSLAFNKYDKFVGTADENMDSREWDVEVLTGKFNIVFIANEHSDAVTSGLLAEIDETTNHSRGYLQENVTFSYEAFSALKDIPMVTLKEDVHIKANYQLEDPDQTVNGGSWSVLMERLGVRIDMALTLEEGQEVEEDAKLTITKIPKKIHLFKGQYNDSDEETDYTSEEYPYIVPTTIDADGKEVLSWKRIILPESMFEETTNKGKGVALAVEVNGDKCETVIGIDAFNDTEQDRDYTLPRNTYLDIAATANPSAKELECEATVKPWDVVSQKVIFDGQYFLKVNEDEFIISDEGGNFSFIAETDYKITNQGQGFPDGLQINESSIIYSSGDGWISFSGGNNGDSERTVCVAVTENYTLEEREAKIFVQAGNMEKIIYVIQKAFQPYLRVNRTDNLGYINASGGSAVFEVETNIPTGWNASVNRNPNGNYASLDLTNSTLKKTTSTLTVDNHYTIFDRTVTLTFSAEGVNDIEVDVIQTGGGGENHILYLDNDILKVGRWGDEIVDKDKIVYFLFGGVIGFSIDGVYSSSSILFNPTTIEQYNNYIELPMYEETDFNEGLINISDPAYHNFTNVMSGKGDPCKLVGKSSDELKAMDNNEFSAFDIDSEWRMPTAQENVRFVRGPNPIWPTWVKENGLLMYYQGESTSSNENANYYHTGSEGQNLGWFPVVQGTSYNTSGLSLPTTGQRDTLGDTQRLDVGHYWSSEIYNQFNGFTFGFSYIGCFISQSGFRQGFAIRCVKTTIDE